MSTQNIEHGLSIGFHRINDELYMKMIIKGKLTHDDYKIITPLFENALLGIKKPKIKALIDARDFKGWDLHAAWDDLKLGLKHSSQFTQIAYVGTKKWENYMIKVSDWFTSGEIRFFEDISDAMLWLDI